MAHDRYDTRDAPRDERSRWRDERFSAHDRDERGFFERAGDEVASWFGDDEAERRRELDRRMDEHDHGYSRDRFRSRDLSDRGRFDRDEGRGFFGSSRISHERGRHPPTWNSDTINRREDDYRPLAGDYGRSERFYAASGTRREEEPARPNAIDPHYHALRRRHIDELDRDYEDYRRENQSRFEEDFTNWRQQRLHKRGLLGQIREQMEVVGSDDERVGTIDRVAGDRIILTKPDPESGSVHHSLSCSDIDRVEQDRVILDCPAEEARHRWRDESRNRALFEREDQGEMGPRMLDRSFEGTYR